MQWQKVQNGNRQRWKRTNRLKFVLSLVHSRSVFFLLSCRTLFPLRAPIKSFWFMHQKPPLFRQPPSSSSSVICKMSYKNKTSSPAGTLRLFVSFWAVLIRKQSTCGWGNKAHSIIYDTSLWIETSSWCFQLSLRVILLLGGISSSSVSKTCMGWQT